MGGSDRLENEGRGQGASRNSTRIIGVRYSIRGRNERSCVLISQRGKV